VQILKGLILLIFLHTVFISCAQKKFNTKVTYIQPYCGGARPTPEMQAEALKAKPYSNRSVIIVSESGKVDSAKTDKTGTLKKSLKIGKYKFFESWRYYKTTPDGAPVSNYDKDCLAKEWEKEFKTVTISKSKTIEESKDQITLNCEWALPCILEKHLPPRRE